MRLLLCVFILILSCEKKSENLSEITEETLYEEKIGDGEAVVKDKLVKFHFQYEQVLPKENERVIQSTHKRGVPAVFTFGYPKNPKDIEDRLDGMNAGGKKVYLLPKGKNMYKLTLEVLEINIPALAWNVDMKNAFTTESGLQCVIIEEGSGPMITTGQRVSVDYSGFLTDLTKFDSSVDKGVPLSFTVDRDAVIRGWHEGLKLMKVGTKARLIIPSELAYRDQDSPVIPANSTLLFDMEVLEIHEPANLWEVDESKAKTTSTGLKYIIIEEGSGETIKSGERVTVDYSGYLTNFTKFDSSVDKGMPYSFTVDKDAVIQGWHEGLKLLKHGSKARLIIPASLGYQNRPKGPIPPNSTLLFDIEVH